MCSDEAVCNGLRRYQEDVIGVVCMLPELPHGCSMAGRQLSRDAG